MSFFEDIASALDAEGIESRVVDGLLCVPLGSECDIQFVEVDPDLPAANVYVAAVEDDDPTDFSEVLVGVVLSTEAAVKSVIEHIATDQVISVLRELIHGTDERLESYCFIQDREDSYLVRADIASQSEVRVHVEPHDGDAVACVTFVSTEESEEIACSRDHLVAEEMLHVGEFRSLERLLDVLSFVAEQSEQWEEQLLDLEFEEVHQDEYGDYFDGELSESEAEEEELDNQ